MKQATKDDKYRSAAISYGSYIVRCQQRDDLSERVPLKGFFFGSERRERMPVPRSITSSEEHAVTGLVGLLRAFPDSEHAAAWETAIRLYADYHKAIAAYTDPYSMLPAGGLIKSLKLSLQLTLRFLFVWLWVSLRRMLSGVWRPECWASLV